MLNPNPNGKFTALALIRAFFLPDLKALEVMEQYKRLTQNDRSELASAIARQYDIEGDRLMFELVPY